MQAFSRVMAEMHSAQLSNEGVLHADGFQDEPRATER